MKLLLRSKYQQTDKLVLPQVGAFDYAIDNLHKSNLWDYINKCVIKENTFSWNMFGHAIAETSEGKLEGLVVPGKIKKTNLTIHQDLSAKWLELYRTSIGIFH